MVQHYQGRTVIEGGHVSVGPGFGQQILAVHSLQVSSSPRLVVMVLYQNICLLSYLLTIRDKDFITENIKTIKLSWLN